MNYQHATVVGFENNNEDNLLEYFYSKNPKLTMAKRKEDKNHKKLLCNKIAKRAKHVEMRY